MPSAKEAHVHILGVRHHGPGSARSLLATLEERKPDCVLIEGPADLSHMINYLGREGLEPPVALVSYLPDTPGRAAYFPFAVFSPEFQAIKFALSQDIPVLFFDLPQAHMMAAGVSPAMPDADPMTLIAQASGHKHYERWWNGLVEERQDAKNMFEGVLELMQALRETELPLSAPDVAQNIAEEHFADQQAFMEDIKKLSEVNPALAKQKLQEAQAAFLEAKKQAGLRLAEQREAHMRRCIRNAKSEGYKNIAVVCGAFHGPALCDIDTTYSAEADEAMLQDMPSVAIDAAWVPWSYGRLSTAGGYGAGVASPGWYHHLWELGQSNASVTEFSTVWLSKVATFLRKEGFDTSSAHIIEAVRLAKALAALREQAFPSLADLMEATQTVMCAGNPHPILLIQAQLIVSERMGQVPLDMPMVPLQKDLHRLQQELRLEAKLEKSNLNLDLRQDLHLKRSHLLHRLRLLSISWGEQQAVRGKRGNYKEIWTLEWKPELALKVIEASRWGNTVIDAAKAFVTDLAQKTQTLDELSALLDAVVLADLVDVLPDLMKRIDDLAASSSDISKLMKALAPLVRVMRYGSVRQTDQGAIENVVDTLTKRIIIGLPSACSNIQDDSAVELSSLIKQTTSIIASLNNQETIERWQDMLKTLSDKENVHGLIAGQSCRALQNARIFSPQDTLERLKKVLLHTATGQQSLEVLSYKAFWIEGFFKGSALSLIHNVTLWQTLDTWVLDVPEENFIEILPLLRRTFSSFSDASRQQLQDRAKQSHETSETKQENFDAQQAQKILPLIAQLLGINEIPAPQSSS